MKKKDRILFLAIISILCVISTYLAVLYNSSRNDVSGAYLESIRKASENFGYSYKGSESENEYSYREAMSYVKASSQLALEARVLDENKRYVAKEKLDKIHSFLAIDLYDTVVRRGNTKLSKCFKDTYDNPNNIESYYKLDEIMNEIQSEYAKGK